MTTPSRRTRRVVALGFALVLVPGLTPAPAQQLRLSAWAGYEGVTDGNDWSALGGQLGWGSARGDQLWMAAERLSRFGARDVVARGGGALHPAARWWFAAEVTSALDPEFAPKNAWEADVTILVAQRASAGVAYRRQNYLVGAVQAAIPHASLDLGRVSWDGRVFLSRNPSDRTDVAFLLRATVPWGRRGAAWFGAGAGQESYLVGTPPAQSVQSLRTVTGIAGARYDAGAGITLRLDVTVIRSKPVLSRRGVAAGIERRL